MAPTPARQARDWVERIAGRVYASPVYGWTLGTRAPNRLKRLPPATWPGVPERGAAIVSGRLVCAGQTVDPDRPDWYGAEFSPQALAELHGFAWLDDLAESGGTAAQDRARQLIASWLDRERRWDPVASDPGVMGRRVASWLSHARLISRGQDDALGPRILASLARQVTHLSRVAGGGAEGLNRLFAIRGVIFGCLCGAGDERRAGAAFKLLRRELRRQILSDGGHIERSPAAQVAALAALVDVRDMGLAAGQHPGSEVTSAIERMAPMLRLFRHGDGGLALFNGSGEGNVARIDAVLTRSAVKGKPSDAATATGFQRLAADRVTVLMDAGAPPPAGFDKTAHAGTLSFEMSWGRERVIVNCGASPVSDPAWQLAQRATAAHSTLVVDDTNSAEILEDGGLGRRPQAVTCTREEDAGNVWIAASHDGYLPLFGLVHQRRIYLSRDGDDLRGEDSVTGTHTGSFAVRFHLHPDVQVSLIQNGGAALLRTPSGAAWRFIASGGRIELAETVYLGRRGATRRSEQIVVSGPISNGAAVKWALRRVGKS